MGGRLYHAGAHSPVSEQTHFTSETTKVKIELAIGTSLETVLDRRID